MSFGAAIEALGGARQHAVPARGGGSDDHRGLGCFDEGFDRCGVRRIAGLGEVRAFDGEEFRRAATGDLVRGGLHRLTNEPDAERAAEPARERLHSLQGFQRRLGKAAVRFGVNEEKKSFHRKKRLTC